MAANSDLPVPIRADAIVTLGRIFGGESLAEVARPLLATDESAQFTMEIDRGTMTATITDCRAVVAYKLSSLGDSVRGLVNEFLDHIALPSDDGWGRYLAAEAAMLICERERAVSFIIPPPTGQNRNIAGEVSVLLSAGRTEAARQAIEETFTTRDPDGRRSYEVAWNIQSIAGMCIRAGHKGLAVEIAERALADPSVEMQVAGLKVLTQAGDPSPAIAFLTTAEINESRDDGEHTPSPDQVPQVPSSEWIDLARLLWGCGHVQEVGDAIDRVLGHSVLHDYSALTMAEFLHEIRNPKGLTLLLWIAQNASPRLRLKAAETLLDSDDRRAGISALLDLSRQNPTDTDDAIELVRTLLLVGAEDDAERLLHEIIRVTRPDRWSDRTDALDLLCQLRPGDGRQVLLDLIQAEDLGDGEVLCAARNLLRLGEHTAALTLLRQRVLDQCDASVRNLVEAARLFGQAGDQSCTIAACERVLTEAASNHDRMFWLDSGVIVAANFLDSVSRIGPRQCEELRIAGTRVLESDVSRGDERDVLTIAQILARNDAAKPAADLLVKVVEARAGSGGADPRTIDELKRIQLVIENA